MNHNFDMSTPINSLPNKTNVNNLIKNVENNIETLNNSGVSNSLPKIIGNVKEPPQYNPIVPLDSPKVSEKIYKVEESKPKKSNKNKKKEKEISLSKYIMANCKEYLIMVLLFSLLAHKKINRLYLTFIPYLTRFESPIPSLLIRGVTFVFIVILIKKFV